MNSEPECAETIVTKSDQESGLTAHSKRKRRRGKRRKQKRDDIPQEENETIANDSEEDNLPEHYRTPEGCKLRPPVPKAPENSTQFLIDDHNECRLYMSFETPNPHAVGHNLRSERDDREIVEPEGEDAAYIDINYEYESPQDFDNSAYHDMEFELAYKSTRFDELLRLPKADLIQGLEVLETRLKELSDDLVKENPSPVLNKLQHEFLELQEKHFELKECNTRLRVLFMQQTGASPEAVDVLVEQPQNKINDDDVVIGTPDSTFLHDDFELVDEMENCDMSPSQSPVCDHMSDSSHSFTDATQMVKQDSSCEVAEQETGKICGSMSQSQLSDSPNSPDSSRLISNEKHLMLDELNVNVESNDDLTAHLPSLSVANAVEQQEINLNSISNLENFKEPISSPSKLEKIDSD